MPTDPELDVTPFQDLCDREIDGYYDEDIVAVEHEAGVRIPITLETAPLTKEAAA